MNKRVVLIILDGWGLGDGSRADAIAQAKTPFADSLFQTYPWSKLEASGEAVGLPAGQMGNSEVGHLTIGAGRTVYQDLVKINKAIRENTISGNKVLLDALEYAEKNQKKLHLIGLLSNGGVHSHITHLQALCRIVASRMKQKAFIHCFLDGRDTDPKAGAGYIRELQQTISGTGLRIASVIGRYYAMDRDNRWDRVKIAYDLLVHADGLKTRDPEKKILELYNDDLTDEFMSPVMVTDEDGMPLTRIEEGDVVICFNFRTDRAREITQALTQRDIHEYNMQRRNLYYVTMTNYDDSFKDIKVLFNKDDLDKTLGEVIAVHQRSQIRAAETEKYPHVTFFFSGGREIPFDHEKRILIPSPKVATYDLQPEMSAPGIRDAILPELSKKTADFICLNFANPDMVGHTGNFGAVVKGVETVDTCLKDVVETGLLHGYSFVIIADHGNADYMINPDGSPNTAHTTNLVPCIIIDKDVKSVKPGTLADIAPTVLNLMNLPVPAEMTGQNLIG